MNRSRNRFWRNLVAAGMVVSQYSRDSGCRCCLYNGRAQPRKGALCPRRWAIYRRRLRPATFSITIILFGQEMRPKELRSLPHEKMVQARAGRRTPAGNSGLTTRRRVYDAERRAPARFAPDRTQRRQCRPRHRRPGLRAAIPMGRRRVYFPSNLTKTCF